MLKKREEWFLIFSGLFTCALVAFVDSLAWRQQGVSLLWLLPYVAFTFLFLLVTVDKVQSGYLWIKPVALWLQGIIAVMLVAYIDVRATPILLVVWAAQLPFVFSFRQAVLGLLGLNAFAFILLPFLLGKQPSWIAAFAYLGFEWFALASSQARQALQQANKALAQSNQQLDATRLLLAQDASRQERLRIARDLHDSIGHQLTAFSLQLEAARHSAPVGQADIFVSLKTQVRQSLHDLRAIVREVRGATATDLTAALRTLSSRLPGIHVELPDSLSVENAALAEQLLLCLQEGISNAVRHGHATTINVRILSQQPLTIELTDNGTGLAKNICSGSGIKGMKERLAAFQGTVTLQNNQQGGACLQLSVEQNHD
ncbi:histidine kinase [Alkalimonas collagenimarina]|uniref:Histidine kinase n=1 Tax=Alkalimonas collagenimarina TaxID=400390 RepID=A0ABT9GYA4_9GAMM|nr:histidine kinase [Alkalimonas collagenimarina]MDP4535943.1 histidine kinase [Alkalimonas collagenimarina]